MMRKILHLDLDAFFCAVEELRQPELRGKAFAVGGRPNERGVVSSCSYPARRFGVHSAMPMSKALRLCPNLIVIPASHGVYGHASGQVMSILRDFTFLVEQVSVDEAFLDLSDLPQPGEELARGIQAKINSQLHLPCSLGVATNKLVAKVATDTGKSRSRSGSYPNAILVVPAGEEAAFLAPMPVLALWGVGPKTAARLESMGIKTIGELAQTSEAALTRLFGVMGHEMGQRARGLDDSPVVTEHEVKSISQEITYDRDVSNGERLRQTLRSMSERVAFRLRSDGLTAGTVRLKIRWSDFSTHTRQVSLEQPTDVDGVIYKAALELFEDIWQAGRPVRLIGVGASKLGERAQQLSLWDTADQKERRLLEALDTLRERYGDSVVRSGRTIKRKKG